MSNTCSHTSREEARRCVESKMSRYIPAKKTARNEALDSCIVFHRGCSYMASMYSKTVVKSTPNTWSHPADVDAMLDILLAAHIERLGAR